MISKEKIESLIAEKLSEGDYFIVSLEISSTNQIKLLVDSMQGITIEECVAFSRAIEHNLDREVEDFELMVASPGLSSPLIIKEQYEKNINRELKIRLKDNSELKGSLTLVNEDSIEVIEEKKEKVEGAKKKQLIKHKHIIKLADIESALVVINF